MTLFKSFCTQTRDQFMFSKYEHAIHKTTSAVYILLKYNDLKFTCNFDKGVLSYNYIICLYVVHIKKPHFNKGFSFLWF